MENRISVTDPNAICKLETKLKELEARQEKMKAANAYYRKLATLEGCPALSEKEIRAINKEMAGSAVKVPFPSYQLTNNNSEIKRVSARIRQINNLKNSKFEERKFSGGRIVSNKTAMLLQIIFDEKPAENICEYLKSHGWKFSSGAWQRKLTTDALYSARNFLQLIKEAA